MAAAPRRGRVAPRLAVGRSAGAAGGARGARARRRGLWGGRRRARRPPCVVRARSGARCPSPPPVRRAPCAVAPLRSRGRARAAPGAPPRRARLPCPADAPCACRRWRLRRARAPTGPPLREQRARLAAATRPAHGRRWRRGGWGGGRRPCAGRATRRPPRGAPFPPPGAAARTAGASRVGSAAAGVGDAHTCTAGVATLGVGMGGLGDGATAAAATAATLGPRRLGPPRGTVRVVWRGERTRRARGALPLRAHAPDAAQVFAGVSAVVG